MATADGNHPRAKSGMIVFKLSVSWLAEDGYHLIECPQAVKAVTVTPAERDSLLAAIHLVADQAADDLHHEFAKRDGTAPVVKADGGLRANSTSGRHELMD